MDAYLTLVIKDYLSGFFYQDLMKIWKKSMFCLCSLMEDLHHKAYLGHKEIFSSLAEGVVGYAITTFGPETKYSLIGVSYI